jgi:peptidoglycan/LPS O-acetylase OafA/YrhL
VVKRVYSEDTLLYSRSTIQEILKFNSFGFLRLLLAIAVVFHHSLVLTGHSAVTYLGKLGGIDLGTLGVAGFFAISGFLLFGSTRRLTSHQFVIHRVFRLFPGLWVCLTICAFAIVPFANRMSAYESSFNFFTTQDSSLSYSISNSILFVFQDSIGTVFGQNTYPLAVNGSLWTLAPEFICYMGLLVVAITSRRNLKIQFGLILFALLVFSTIWMGSQSQKNEIYSQIVNPASGLAIAFCTGSLLAILLGYFPIRPGIIPSLIGLAMWTAIGANGPLSLIILSILIVSLGIGVTSKPLVKIGRDVDLSYGIYLYHFPITQTILATGTYAWSRFISPTLLTILVLAVSVIFAFLSWKFVEKPSILMSRSITLRSK